MVFQCFWPIMVSIRLYSIHARESRLMIRIHPLDLCIGSNRVEGPFSELGNKPVPYKLEGKLSRSLKLSLQQPTRQHRRRGDAQISSMPPFVATGRTQKNTMPQYLTSQRCSLQTLFVLNFLFLERRGSSEQENKIIGHCVFP